MGFFLRLASSVFKLVRYLERYLRVFFLVIDDTSTQSSNLPKGHCRSQSDGTVMTQSEDLTDAKKDLKSMKAILAQLLSSNCGITPIQVRK